MKRVHLVFLLIGLLTASLQTFAQNVTPPIRVYKIGDKLFTRDASGGTPTTSPYAIASVDATNTLIQLTIGKLVRYYSPENFLDANGSPWGATVIDAVTAFQNSANPPVIIGGGGGGSTTDASQITTGTLSESRLPTSVVKTTSTISNPTFITALDPSRIAQSSTARLTTDAEKAAWNAKLDNTSAIDPTKITQSSTARLTTDTEKATWNNKLDNTSALDPTKITQGPNARLTTDTEKATWNAKLDASSALDPTKLTQSATARLTTDTEKATWNAKQSAITNSSTITPGTVNVNTAITVPTLPLNDSTSKAAPSELVSRKIQVAITTAVNMAVKRALDSVSLSFSTRFNASQFYNDPSLGVSITGYPFSGTSTTPPSSTTTSPGSTTGTGSAITGPDLTFTNAEFARPITLFAGPPRYYQGTVGEGWGAGGNAAIANTKLPAGADGWVTFQFAANTQVAIGFDTVNVVQPQLAGYFGMRAGLFVFDNTLGIVRDGALINSSQTATAISYLRLRRAIVSGVTTIYTEYSTNGTSWTAIVPTTASPFTLKSTGDYFVRVAINGDNKLISPQSSTTFVTR